MTVPNSKFPAALYETQLAQAVSSGAFSTILQKNAATFNATSLLHAASVSLIIGNNDTFVWMFYIVN